MASAKGDEAPEGAGGALPGAGGRKAASTAPSAARTQGTEMSDAMRPSFWLITVAAVFVTSLITANVIAVKVVGCEVISNPPWNLPLLVVADNKENLVETNRILAVAGRFCEKFRSRKKFVWCECVGWQGYHLRGSERAKCDDVAQQVHGSACVPM